jgi:hypothetical protein
VPPAAPGAASLYSDFIDFCAAEKNERHGDIMRRTCRPIGLYIAGVGALIVLAVILPACLWWIALGLALVFIGLSLFRCC